MADTLEVRTSSPIDWRPAQMGLWVASMAGGHPLGIITERWVHGFVVTTRTGKDLGSYLTLDEAKSALEASL
jgi:frataxin-like iron-binding protein CyaY